MITHLKVSRDGEKLLCLHLKVASGLAGGAELSRLIGNQSELAVALINDNKRPVLLFVVASRGGKPSWRVH